MPDTVTPLPTPAQAGVSGQSPAQGTGATDWGSVVARYDGLQGQSANSNMVAASGANPDHAAIARTLSPVLGVAPSVIEADPQTYSDMFALRSDRATVARDPVFQAWMAANPIHARVAQGDVQQLGAFGTAMRAFGSAWQQGSIQDAMNWIGVDQGDGQARPSELNALQTDREKLAALQAGQPLPAPAASVPATGLAAIRYPGRMVTPAVTSAAGVGAFLGSNVQGLVAAVPAAAAGAVTGAVAGSVLPGAGTAAGAVTGAVRGFAAYEGTQAYGQVYRQTSEITDQTGKPIPEATKQIVSVGAGLITAALNTVGGGEISAPVKAGLSKLATDAATKLATDPVAARALSSFGARMAKAGLVGAAVNGGQAAAQLLAPQIAQALAMPGADTVFSDPAKRAALVDQVVQQAKIGLLVVPTFELGLHGLSLLGGGMKAEAALEQAGGFDRAMDAAHASKTRGRAPDVFQTLAAAHVAAGGPDTLYVPGDAAMALYQRLGTTPGAPDDPFRFVPDMRDQLEQAQATGGDVQIPMADYAAHVPAEVDQALRASGQVRFAPDGMTAAEAAEFHAQHAGSLDADPAFMQSLADELSKGGEDRDDKIGIVSDAYDQMRSAGYTEDAANQHASLIGERYATRGARLGVSPLELYRDEGLSIQRAPAAAPMAPDALDRVMDTIRLGSKLPTDRELHGPSLAEFLSYPPRKGKTQEQLMHMTAEQRAAPGGLRDPNGDLAAMDAHLWHKAEPFRNRLIHKDGMSQDDATLHAWQHGYFPDHTERPDINDLHEALRRELSGQPVYRRLDADGQAQLDFRNAVDGVQRVLDQEGIDPREASNDEIKAALDRHATETTLMQSSAREPAVVLRGDELGAYSTHEEMIAAVRAAFKSAGESGPIYNPELGNIQITRSGVGKALSRIGPEKAALIPGLRQIIEKGRLVGSEPTRKPDGNVRAFHTIETPIRVGNADFVAKTIIRENHDGKFFYDVRRVEGAPELFQARGGAPSENPSVLPADEAPGSPGPTLSTDHDLDVRQKSDGIKRPDGDAGVRNTIPGPGGTNGEEGGAGGLNSNPGSATAFRDDPELFQGMEPSTSNPRVGREGHADDLGQPAGDINLSFSQPGDDGIRGSIAMADNARTITLFRQANLSTVLHELGHQWLDELERDAVREDAPPELRDDLATVHKWLGVAEGERARVEHHEKWAQGFEAYLMEGKAPSEALRGPFQKFAAWLARIYRSVVTLGGAVPPRIAGVMDRLLATDDAIEQARSGLGLRNPLFKTPADAGMSIDEWHRYQRAMRGAKDAAYDKVLHRAMKVERDRTTAEWKQAAIEARPQVEAAVKARPVLRAWSHLALGKDIGDPEATPMKLKLDRASVEGILHGSIERLPHGVIGADGMHPDTIAPVFGYDSGEQMLDDLISENGAREAMAEQTGNPVSFKKYVAALVDQGTDEAVRAKLGDVLSDGGIEESALQAAHNATQADVLTMEMRAAANKAGIPNPMQLRHLKAYVAGKLADMRIGDATRVAAYRRAEAKGGRDAERALLAGKPGEAFQAKQRQLMAHLYATRAQEIAADWDRAMKYWRGIAKQATRVGVDQVFMDQAHGVLARLGMTPARDAGELARGLEGKPLDRFIEDQAALGYEMIVPDFVRSGAALPHYTDLTADQFQGAADAVRSIMHNGRAALAVTLDGKRVALDDLVGEAVARLDEKPSLPRSSSPNPDKVKGVEGALFAAAHGGRVLDAALLRPEKFMEEMDGGRPGPFSQVFDRIKQAGYDARDYETKIAAALGELKKKLPDGWSKNIRAKVIAHELIDPKTGKPFDMSHDETLALALNVGNASNLDKLTRGYGWDEASVMQFLHRTMTKADWDFTQGVWNLYESMFPDVERTEREINGIGLGKVDHTPIDTQFGRYDGGYYPVIYDPRRAPTPMRAGQADSLFDEHYYRPATSKSHTIARTEYAAPIRLSTDPIGTTLSQVIHRMTHQRAITDAAKFFDDRRVHAAIEDKMGHEYTRLMPNYLRDLANVRNIDSPMQHWIGLAARNFGAVGIGFNPHTVMRHGLTAFSNSISTVGAKDFAMASAALLNPRKTFRIARWIMQESGEMRHRFESVDNNAREVAKGLRGKHSWVESIQRLGYYPVAAIDFASAMPTWLAAYRRGMADGMEHSDAVRHSDRMVRNAHGSSAREDLSAVQRDKNLKPFTLFYSFENHMYNQGHREVVRGTVSAARNIQAKNYVGARRDMVAVAGASWSYIVLPGIISALTSNQDYESLYGGNEPWWEEIGKGVLGDAVGVVPFLRDFGAAFIGGYQYRATPLDAVGENAKMTATDIARATGLSDKPVSDRWLEHGITTAGYLTGLPVGAAARTGQYLWDIADGDTDPASFGQFMHGLIYGPPPVKK